MFDDAIQKYRFNKLRGEFGVILSHLKKIGAEPFVMPFWNRINTNLERILLPAPEIDFLNTREIKDTMLVNGSHEWLESQLSFFDKLGLGISEQLKESEIGKPARLPKPYDFTSHNKIHHLYHIYFYLDQTQKNIDDIHTVVEWGGGYGNLAYIWWGLKSGKTTYTIIDTGLFCSIQWLYLSSVLGEKYVNLLTKPGDQIQVNKINIVPLALLKNTKIDGDLFISTWGLSESKDTAQDYVIDKNWFGCSGILLGFQDKTEGLEYADRLGKLAKSDGAKIINIKFIPKNHYAFR